MVKNKEMYQKLRYKFISQLVMDLFSNKNSPSQYKDTSEKILSYLKSVDDIYPIDMVSEVSKKSFRSHISIRQETLMGELEGN